LAFIRRIQVGYSIGSILKLSKSCLDKKHHMMGIVSNLFKTEYGGGSFKCDFE
jgi:hypothetical protein